MYQKFKSAMLGFNNKIMAQTEDSEPSVTSSTSRFDSRGFEFNPKASKQPTG